MTEESEILKKVKKLEDKILRKVLYGHGDRCNPIGKGVSCQGDVLYSVDSELFVVFPDHLTTNECVCGWYKDASASTLKEQRPHTEEVLLCRGTGNSTVIVNIHPIDHTSLADCLYDTCLIRKHAELYRLTHAKKEQKSKEKQE